MKMLHRLPRTTLIASLLILPFLAGAAVPSQSSSKLDKRLASIADAAAQHVEASLRDAALARQANHRNTLLEPRWNSTGQVQVYIHYDPSSAAPDHEQLAALGATDIVDSAQLGVIQAWVPAAQLQEVGKLPSILRVGLPRYALPHRAPTTGPVTYTGSVDTQGDTILHVAGFRKTTKVTGQGVTVGVISDGDDHISESQKTGDLPTDITDDPHDKGGTGGFSPASSGDEGTAMMEIVYDIAPGVSHFGFCGPQTTVDFITCLQDFQTNISANVIVDDLGFPGEAMFTQDTFSSGVQAFATNNPNIALVTAAGNDGTGFWGGTWAASAVNTNVNGIHYSVAQTFEGSAGSVPYLHIVANLGDTIGYIVQWADPWSDTATSNDPNDYDVVVFDNPNGDSSGGPRHTAVACNQGINIGPTGSGSACDQANSQSVATPGPQPAQGSEWTANQTDYYLEVFKQHGNPSDRIKILVFDQSSFQVFVDPATAGSIFGKAALANPAEITVGAVYEGDLNRESYSSTGPVDMGTGSQDFTVQKPDFVAPDCVNVTGAGGFQTPFCGTSAAAPHIAGLVALMMSGYPDTSPYQLLQESATAKGAPVPNGDYGYGLPNMQTLLNKDIKPTPKKSSSSGGGDMDLLALLVLGAAAGLRRKRRTESAV
ncbi:MAG TPA: S8 family serine peptidase [Gammaproteobacteria bacterium]|jgi:MYXO-CTERM domain-containing protein